MQKITVVLPTYNECENIVVMIRNILALNIPGLRVVVADDASSDGTQQAVLEHFSDDQRVRLYNHPPPRGLSPSVVDAFDLEHFFEKKGYYNRSRSCGFWLLVYDDTGEMLYAGRYDSSLTPAFHKQSCSLARENWFEPRWKEE